MSRWRRRLGRWTSRYVLLPAIVALGVCGLLPLLETNLWWVRYLDFARIQFFAVLAAILVVYLLIGQWRRRIGMLAIGLGLAALVYNGYRLAPYVPLPGGRDMAPADCPAGARLRVMSANVQAGNRRSDKLISLVRRAKPDIFLALETDRWWNHHLAPLDAMFAHQVENNPKNAKYYGIHLFSKRPLAQPSVRFFFGATTPTIVTGIKLAGRRQPIQFIGLHPRPPLSWSQPSTIRDGHIIKASLLARHSHAATIIAGDFNAVSWERVTRRALRLGRLMDPRIHRGFIPSFNTKHLPIAWPLDHILYQKPLQVIDFKRLPAFGSDHYPVMADLCTAPRQAPGSGTQPPAVQAGDKREARAAITAAQHYEQQHQPAR